MADSTTRQMKNLIRKIKRVADNLPKDQYLEPAAEDVIKSIRQRSRNGYGLSKNGKTLKPLENKTETTTRRQYDEKEGLLSNKTTARIANLTRSGSLLDNLTTQKIKKGVVAIVPGSAKDTIKAAQLEALGQRFLGVTVKEGRIITKKIADGIVRNLNRLFK